MVKNYEVVTLCGSTRFKDEFIKEQKRLTLEGKIVISVGLFGLHPVNITIVNTKNKKTKNFLILSPLLFLLTIRYLK